jgi:lincosamide nucleotidyltransferase A/C/D/E
MTADEVLRMLDLLETHRIRVWVDGGWGIDALLGEQTRPHSDLDLSIVSDDLDSALALFTSEGFETLRDDLPTAIAMRHPDGREVDLHPVQLTPDGGGDQIQPDGSLWHYDRPVTGSIAGRDVTCLSPETQVRAHLGFEPRSEHIADMGRLRDLFGIELPGPYGTTN